MYFIKEKTNMNPLQGLWNITNEINLLFIVINISFSF